MNFKDAVVTCFRKSLVFKGRAARSEYWWFYLFTILVSFVIGFAEAALGLNVWSTDLTHPMFGIAEGPLSFVMMIVLLLPSVSVLVRRLHDRNHSGLWAALPYSSYLALPFLGSFSLEMAALSADPTADWSPFMPVFVLAGLWVLAMLGMLVFMLIRRGTQGVNRFGPDPLAPQDMATIFA